MTNEASDRDWSLWRRLAAEFVVIVVGVLVALGVDAARDAREDRVREAAYLAQLRIDLAATAASLAEAISVDERARDGADEAIRTLDGSRRLPSDSLTRWTIAATNSSASFYPTMGTVTALVEGVSNLESPGVSRSIGRRWRPIEPSTGPCTICGWLLTTACSP